MTTVLCPVSFAVLRVGWSEALVWCPRCATHHPRRFLADRDDTPCTSCGHPARTHAPRYGLAYACGLTGCGCQPKEKPMPDIKTVVITEIAAALDRLARKDISTADVAGVLGVGTAWLHSIESAVRCECGDPANHVVCKP